MSEYIFIHLLDKKPVGSEVGESLPLHITVLHWFESDVPQETVIDEAQVALHSVSGITTRVTEPDLFGPNVNIPVMQVAKTPELVNLHTSLLLSMQGLGATFNNNWSGAENWNPHIIDKPDMKMSAGDEVIINDIDLAVRFGKHGARTLLHRFDIASEL